MASTRITRGLVVLWCGRNHDHQMAPEQARRIRHERCPWCGSTYVRIDLAAVSPRDRPQVERLLELPTLVASAT